MSDKVKAADAKFGEWYESDSGTRYRCAQSAATKNEDVLFVRRTEPRHSEVSAYFEVSTTLTHLPDCTGWDWQPTPPEPDTSLEASIKALADANDNAFFAGTRLQGGMQADEAIDCVLDAARKWDEAKHFYGPFIARLKRDAENADSDDPDGVVGISGTGEPCDTKQGPCSCGAWHNDHDGIGEGWRLLKYGEVIREGDQYESCRRWYATHDAGLKHKSLMVRRRRRLVWYRRLFC